MTRQEALDTAAKLAGHYKWRRLTDPEFEDTLASIKAHADSLIRIAELEAENEKLKAIVKGWHYLAVGPDEMGDYYTHKELVKLSEPYGYQTLKEKS